MSARTASFVNSRTSFQRLADAKVFRGWVAKLDRYEVAIHLSEPITAGPGQVFRFEVPGADETAVFNARFAGMTPNTLICSLESHIRYVPLAEERRIRARGVRAVALTSGYEGGESDAAEELDLVQAEIVDVSAKGFGMVLPRKLERGSRLEVTLEGPAGHAHCSAEVRYCRTQDDRFRVGLRIIEMDRLSRGAYIRLIQSLAE